MSSKSRFIITQQPDLSLNIHDLFSRRNYKVNYWVRCCYKACILSFDFSYKFESENELKIVIDKISNYTLICKEYYKEMDINIETLLDNNYELKDIIYTLRGEVMRLTEENKMLKSEIFKNGTCTNTRK